MAYLGHNDNQYFIYFILFFYIKILLYKKKVGFGDYAGIFIYFFKKILYTFFKAKTNLGRYVTISNFLFIKNSIQFFFLNKKK